MLLALAHVWKAVSLWFLNTSHPTTDMLGKQLGVSASSGGALDRLVHVLLKHEAAVAVRMQSDMQLRGIIEADGTSVRHWQSGGCLHYHQWFGMIERNPSGNKRSRKLVLWDIGVATAKRHGKPPPESFAKISRTGACNSITTTHTGYKSLLCSDGAPCYPKVASSFGCLHRSVNHSKGEFNRTDRLRFDGRKQRIDVHTGTIDAAWHQLKDAIPSSLAAQSPKISVYIRAKQFRMVNAHEENLMDVCVRSLKQLLK